MITHVMRTSFGVEQLATHGRLDGWFPGYALGYQLFLLRGPGLTWLTTLVRCASFGQLSTIAALNVVVLGSFVLFPLAVAFLGRSLGLRREAAGVSALLAVIVSHPFCEGFRGLFGIGILENQVAALFFCLALGGLARTVTSEGRAWAIFSAAAMAMLFLTHVPSAAVFGPFALLQLPWIIFTAHRPLAAMARAALASLLALGAIAFWLVPLLAHRDLVGVVVTGHGVPPLWQDMKEMVHGELLYPPWVGWLVLVGWVLVIRRAIRGQWRDLGLAVGPALYILLGHTLYSWHRSGLTEQIAVRGSGHAGVLAAMPLAMLVAGAVRPLGFLGVTGALVLAAHLAVRALAPFADYAGPYPEGAPALHETASALARLVPRGARFAVPEAGFPPALLSGGLYTPDRWLNWRSGRFTLTGLIEPSSTPWVAATVHQADTMPPGDWADRLSRLGVTHVVATGDLAARLRVHPRFSLKWEAWPLIIFEVHAKEGHPAPASLVATVRPARARLRGLDPEHPRFKLWASAATEASVAIAWSPKWHASIDGRQIATRRTPDGLILVDVPMGRSVLALDFLADQWDWLGRGVSLATLTVVLAWTVAPRH